MVRWGWLQFGLRQPRGLFHVGLCSHLAVKAALVKMSFKFFGREMAIVTFLYLRCGWKVSLKIRLISFLWSPFGWYVQWMNKVSSSSSIF